MRPLSRRRVGIPDGRSVRAENAQRWYQRSMKPSEVILLLRKMLSRSSLLAAMPVVLALLLSGVISFSYNRLLKDYRDAVDHTFQTLSGIDNALMGLQDAETGQRGFIITGDNEYLAPFEAGRLGFEEVLGRLGTLVADNAGQKTRTTQLRDLADAKFAELSDTIKTRKAGGLEAARLKVLDSTGKQTMDKIRAIAADMRSAESELLEARLASARLAERMMILVAVICVALSLLGRLLAFLINNRLQNRARSSA
jgi:methyl-accepting chemotaxis protein